MTGPRTEKNADSDVSDLTDDVINQLGGEEEIEGDDDEFEEADEPARDEGDEEEEEREEEEGDEGEEEESEAKPEKLQADKHGNLVDSKGKVIAPAGAARRFYEDLQREKVRSYRFYQDIQRRDGVMKQAAGAMKELQQKLVAAEQGNNLPKQLGLGPTEAVEALNFMAKFKNPATTLDSLKYILTKAAQRGIDIKPLGAGQGAFDPAALTQSLENKLTETIKPLQDRLTAEQEQDQLRREVGEEIRNFVNDNPEAERYLPVIGKIIANPQFQGVGLNGAWLMLQNYMLRKHLTGGSPRQQRQRSGRRPRFEGRARPGAAVNGRDRGEIDDSPMNVDMDFKDIVKSVLNDYGTPS